jgi:predicted kinase
MKHLTLPTFIMLVGLPGSGKSTWRNSVENLSEYEIVSSDDYIDKIALREGKTYTEVFDSAVKEASREMQITFDKAIADKKHIIWDQTNLSAKKRKGVLSRLPKGYLSIAVVFEVELDVIKARIKKRAEETGKNIPEFVIINMLKTYEKPTVGEGFNKIITV